MLKHGEPYIVMQILPESLLQIHLCNSQHLGYKSKVFLVLRTVCEQNLKL